MSRIADHRLPQHYVEEGYLARLINMAKLRLAGDVPEELKASHTLTLEYIYQWKHQYRYKIASCDGAFPRFDKPPIHEAAVKYFDALTQDLIKWLEGGEAVSYSRLEESGRHLSDISQCMIDPIKY
jgi:hypothetical protein